MHSKPSDDRTSPPIVPGAIVLLLLAAIGGTGTPARADGQKLFKHPTPLTENHAFERHRRSARPG